MSKNLSRRAFLKAATVAAMSAGVIVGPFPKRAFADKGRGKGKKNELVSAFEDVLAHKVHGTEKHNDIASRLAITLGRMGGRSRHIPNRQALLLNAAEQAEDALKKGRSEKRTVSQNLNELIKALRAQPAPAPVIHSIVDAVADTVLFATRGIHFPDTREAQQRLREAILARKHRPPTLVSATQLSSTKSIRRAVYRDAVASRTSEISNGAKFPEETIIRGVWIMPRSLASH